MYARYRCVGQGDIPRTSAFPASLCNGPRSSPTSSLPCPPGARTLDDQLAVVPAALLRSFFRERFHQGTPPPPPPLLLPNTSSNPLPAGESLADAAAECADGGGEDQPTPPPVSSAAGKMRVPKCSSSSRRVTPPPPPPAVGTAAAAAVCPATVKWPEGILTASLLGDGVSLRELTGVQTRRRGAAHGTHGAQHEGDLDF